MTETDPSALLPCPSVICGYAEPSVRHYSHGFDVECPNCNASTTEGRFKTEAEAIAAWNRRAPVALAITDEMVEAALDELEENEPHADWRSKVRAALTAAFAFARSSASSEIEWALRDLLHICDMHNGPKGDLFAPQQQRARNALRGVPASQTNARDAVIEAYEAGRKDGAARDHFGSSEHDEPGCMIRVQLGEERGLLMALRRAEDQLARYRNEDSDADRAMGAMVAKHATELRTAEEAGYAKGLRDAKAEASAREKALADAVREMLKDPLLLSVAGWYGSIEQVRKALAEIDREAGKKEGRG